MKKQEDLLYEEEDGIGIITLNRPERLNALSISLQHGLGDLLDELENRDEVKCVILTGARRPDGRPCFSAGADIKEMKERGGASLRLSKIGKGIEQALWASMRDNAEGEDSLGTLPLSRVYRFPKPLIAAIDGICTAGGHELALCCDLRIVAETAQISDMHMKNLGRLGGAGIQTRLPQCVGLAKAKEILWTGLPFDGKEAYRIGWANQVCPSSELIERAKKLAKIISSMNPLGIRVSKLVLNASLNQTTYQSLRFSDLVYFLAGYVEPKGFASGVEAFTQKGKRGVAK
jgi:enoyl-CoA hydratase/carnithine racemase